MGYKKIDLTVSQNRVEGSSVGKEEETPGAALVWSPKTKRKKFKEKEGKEKGKSEGCVSGEGSRTAMKASKRSTVAYNVAHCVEEAAPSSSPASPPAKKGFMFSPKSKKRHTVAYGKEQTPSSSSSSMSSPSTTHVTPTSIEFSPTQTRDSDGVSGKRDKKRKGSKIFQGLPSSQATVGSTVNSTSTNNAEKEV